MTEFMNKNEAAFDFEPLVVPETVGGFQPDILARAGLVVSDYLQGPMWVPRVVATRLDAAHSQLLATTKVMANVGILSEPLRLELLAGYRDETTYEIIRTEAIEYWDASVLGPWSIPMRRARQCTMEGAHIDKRSVDVVLLGAESGKVFDVGYCYASTRTDAIPQSFVQGVSVSWPEQRAWARRGLLAAMNDNGFQEDLIAKWHFTYSGSR